MGRDLGVAKCGHPVVVNNKRKYEGGYVGTPKRRKVRFKQGDPVIGGNLSDQVLGTDGAIVHERVGGALGHSEGGSLSEDMGDRGGLARGLDLQGGGEGDSPKRRRIRVKTRDPSFGVSPDCWGRVKEEGSQDSKDPCKRRRILVKSMDTLGGMLVASDSRGGDRGSCQRGSRRTEPITSDPGYNDGLHWPG